MGKETSLETQAAMLDGVTEEWLEHQAELMEEIRDRSSAQADYFESVKRQLANRSAG